MEKNRQPLIITSIIVGAVLIIALALIFTRGSDDTATETANENNTSENQENENTGENGQQTGISECDAQEATDSNPDCQNDGSGTARPVQQITCAADGPTYDLESDGSWIDENGVRRTACEAPTTPTGTLPSIWNSLTPQEKTDLNPFDCDTETQVIWETDGTCHDKVVNPSSSYRTDTPFTYQFEDGLEVKITSNFNCQPFIDVYNDLLSNDRSAKYADNLIDQFYEVLELPKTEDTFLRDAALYQQCSFEMAFENTGADYHYNAGASLRRYPYNSCNFAGPVAEPWPVLIDQSSNEHPSLRPYSLTPWPVSVVMTDPPTLARIVLYSCAPVDKDRDLVFEIGDVVRSDDDFVWLLSDDTEIQQMQVILGNRGVESVVLYLVF